MNYYDKDGSYIASDLPLDLPEVTEKEYKARLEKEQERRSLFAQLDDLDLKAIRALRALSAGVGTVEDKAKLEELESQAAEIRRQIKEL